jgi:hypothetical protein
MKTLIYMALFMVSALALAQTNMNGAPELSNEAIESDVGLNQEEIEARQDMEDLNQDSMQGIEGAENQDSPSDMSTVPETTPSF